MEYSIRAGPMKDVAKSRTEMSTCWAGEPSLARGFAIPPCPPFVKGGWRYFVSAQCWAKRAATALKAASMPPVWSIA